MRDVSSNKIVKFFIFYLFACLLLVIYYAVHYALCNNTPFYWDYAVHVLASLKEYSFLKEKHYFEYLFTYTKYPPLSYWAISIIIYFFGYSKLTYTFFNLILLLLCLISMYLFIVKKTSSLLAIGISIFSLGFILHINYIMPNSYIPIYQFMLDFPLISTTLIAYLAINELILGESSSFKLFITGILIGFSILTKWTALTIIFFPIVCLTLKLIKIKNRSGFLLITGILFGGGWWYLIHSFTLYSDWQKWKSFLIPSSTEEMYIKPLISMIPFLSIWIIPSLFVNSSRIYRTLKCRKNEFFNSKLEKFGYLGLVNGIISYLIFCYLPVHDFRFIYSTLFVFSFHLAFIILYKLKSVLQKLLIASFCIYTLSVIITLQPKISSDVYGIDIVKHYIYKLPQNSLSIFFENDTGLFNGSNVELAYEEYNIDHNKQLKLMSRINNNFDILNVCETNNAKPYLLVYRSTPLIFNTTIHADFKKTCPRWFIDQYTLDTSIEVVDGTVQLFKKL